MEKDSRIARAQDAALDKGLDYIMEVHSAPDFVEVIGSMGGDVITLRIYDDVFTIILKLVTMAECFGRAQFPPNQIRWMKHRSLIGIWLRLLDRRYEGTEAERI